MKVTDKDLKVILKYISPKVIINLHTRNEITLSSKQIDLVLKLKEDK